MKGSDERDMLFARLFGLSAITNSGCLFRNETSTIDDFQSVIEQLVTLGAHKGWLRESAWWGIYSVVERLLECDAAWREEAEKWVVERVMSEKGWSQEKAAIVLLLEQKRPVSRR